MISPVRGVRERFEMSRADLARVSNLRPATISDVERGIARRLPSKLLTAVVRLGVDEANLIAKHEQFCQEVQQELMARATRAQQCS